MAVRFSAATQFYNTTTNLPTSSTFTFTAWVLLSVDRNDYSEVISFGSTYMSLSTQVDGTTVGVFDGGSYNSTPLGGTAFTVGTWAKIAVVVSGTNVSYYRAATPGAALTLSTASNYTSGTPTQLRIGAYFGDGFFWNGRVANFKLWDAALTQTEIEHELAQYRPRRTANLLHFHPFVRTETSNYAGGTALTGGTGSTTEDGPPIPWTGATPKLFTTAAAAGVDLNGVGTAAGSATGALSTGRALTATAGAASGASGSLSVTRPIAGTASAGNSSTGTLGVNRTLAGSSSAAAEASGSLTTQGLVDLNGSTTAASGATGALTIARTLTGSVPAASDATGSAGTTRTLTAVAAAASGFTGDLSTDSGTFLCQDFTAAAVVDSYSTVGEVDTHVATATVDTYTSIAAPDRYTSTAHICGR